MTLKYTLSPPEHCFTSDHSLPEAYKTFVLRYGYAATEDRKALGLLRLGPIHALHTAASVSLRAGNVILLDGQWHTIADIDGSTVLDSVGELLDLPTEIQLRS
jgi:hypothetical protein